MDKWGFPTPPQFDKVLSTVDFGVIDLLEEVVFRLKALKNQRTISRVNRHNRLSKRTQLY